MTRLTPYPHRRRPLRLSRGFTLIELMIAVAIIVLMVGMAIPVFRAISGGRSQEGAANQIAAMLAQARNDAVGLQVNTGVAFFTDAIGRCRMAEVQSVQPISNTSSATIDGPVSAGTYGVATDTGTLYINPADVPSGGTTTLSGWTSVGTASYFPTGTSGALLDQVPGTDVLSLPQGVGVQVMNDASGTTNDRYLHTAAVMFDRNGRLVTQPYGFASVGVLGKQTGLKLNSGQNINQNSTSVSATPPPNFGGSSSYALYSGPGVVTYDAEATAAQGFPATDSTITGATMSAAESNEQGWLDKNATPLLLNRYNGTLLRSE